MLETTDINGVPEMDVKQVQEQLKKCRIIDVRRPDEFTGELGHIDGAELITLGPDLFDFLQNANKEEDYIFVCRSGKRSADATLMALDLGFNSVANMTGGMIAWNEFGLPIIKK